MDYPNSKRYFSILIAVFFLSLFSISSVNGQDGVALYNANCKSCHAIKEKVIGPALMGVSKRKSEEWLIKWIRNSQAVIKSGDEYAVKLFAEYNKVAMTSFNLKDDEIKAILAYVKAEEVKIPATPPPPPPGSEPANEKPIWPWLLVAAIVLYLLSGVLRRVQETLASAVRQKEGIPEPEPISNKKRNREWIRQNKKLIAIVAHDVSLLFIIGTRNLELSYKDNTDACTLAFIFPFETELREFPSIFIGRPSRVFTTILA